MKRKRINLRLKRYRLLLSKKCKLRRGQTLTLMMLLKKRNNPFHQVQRVHGEGSIRRLCLRPRIRQPRSRPSQL